MDTRDNPYATPTASLDDTPGEAAATPFYVVGTMKFLVLYVATMGVYSVYWFYRNWRNFKEDTKQDIWPIPRAIFSVFFVHALFRSVDERLRAHGKDFPWSPGSLATLLVILMIVSNVLDRVASKIETVGVLDVASLLLLLPIAFVMLRAQGAINLACDDAEGASNNRLTGLNFLWLALGAIVWALVAIGLVAG
jgi:hypothetical protein